MAARDPHGFRPLALGRLGDGWVVCSETCAMDLVGATYVRDVEPGEVLLIGPDGLRSVKPFPPAPSAHCIFEHVYFARPDSEVFGKSVSDVRTAIEVRGALEGLAARHLAERGLGPEVRAALLRSVEEGAAILAKGHLVEGDIAGWSRLNQRFHDAIVHAHDSHVIADAIARNNHLPFASADSIALDRTALPAEYEKLRIAQVQHQLVLDALERRESARVEMLMREHAWVGVRYGQLFGLPTLGEAQRGGATTGQPRLTHSDMPPST